MFFSIHLDNTLPTYDNMLIGYQYCSGPGTWLSAAVIGAMPAMSDSEPFVDYYKILQVDPNCDQRTLETAYHHLAKAYHPDHSEEPDVGKLTEVIEAFRALREPEERLNYDVHYASATGFTFTQYTGEFEDQKSAASDAEVHEKFLLFLYKKRRENARDAGVGRFYVQQELNCSDELFEFHVWYLRSKGLIETTEQGTLAITIEGVDHVIAISRSTVSERNLRLTQSSDSRDQAQP